jgi:hypothetical protein
MTSKAHWQIALTRSASSLIAPRTVSEALCAPMRSGSCLILRKPSPGRRTRVKDFTELTYAGISSRRGGARIKKGDLDGAIEDYTERIRLKPDYADAYLGRGLARREKRDLAVC